MIQRARETRMPARDYRRRLSGANFQAMTDDLRLSELRIPPGYRVTIHLGEKPPRAFPAKPKLEGAPPATEEPSAIAEPSARIEIFRDGHSVATIDIPQSSLDDIAELVQLSLEGKEENEDEPRRLVEVYCSKCGYNLMENVDTGAKVPMVIRMTEAQIAEASGPSTTCGVCGGPIAVRDVPESPRPETKVYQFPKPRE